MTPSLTVRAWNPHDGNPGNPERVLGIPVERLLAKRPDAPGALVTLEDRRFALTGQIAAIGRHRVLRTYVRGRARSKPDRAYRAWLTEVSEVLESMLPERSFRTADGGQRRSSASVSAPPSQDSNFHGL